MFNFFKSKSNKHTLALPANGKVIPLSEVPDPAFSGGVLGDGAAVIPADGKIYAPADSEVAMVFDTLHAISLQTEYNAEILIHVGLDTVSLKGDPFTVHVKAGDHVKKGDLLITADLGKIEAAGLSTITPVIICNSSDFASVEMSSASHTGDDFLTLKDK
ncbi:MAG: PTS glucose transporter subunit IIA [Acetatifactor sp.]|nr:PTS glucose transporter subunit IIA [Acetatifactor sp.]